MGKLMIKILPTDECNEDFTPDEKLQKGLKCDGALIVLFENGEPSVSITHGVSVDMIRKFLKCGDDVASDVRQACALAEGELKAYEIYKETIRKERMKDLAKNLADAIKDGNVGFGMP